MPRVRQSISLGPEVEAIGDAIAGAGAGVFSLLVMYPLDTIKTRNTVKDINSKLNESKFSRKKAGTIAELYHGLGIGLIADGVQSAAYYYFYTLLRKMYIRRFECAPGTAASLGIGSLAGCLNMTLTLPLSTLHTRMQTAKLHVGKSKISLLETTKEILKDEGISGLWAGLRTSLILVINPSITFFAFETLKRALEKYFRASGKASNFVLNSYWIFILGALAKLIATIITYPLILVKTRLQTGGDADGRYNGMRDVINRVYRKFGVKGLYSGMNSKLLQTCFSSAIKFAMKDVFEDASFLLLIWILRITGNSPQPSKC